MLDILYIENQLAEVSDLCPEILRKTQTWKDLLEAFDAVLYAFVDQPVDQLIKIRENKVESDLVILKKSLRLLGYDVPDDMLELSSYRAVKVIPQLAPYFNYSGTSYLKNILEVLLNASITITPLYTNDYINFVPTVPSGENLVTQNGTWFLTTTVDVSMEIYNINNYSILDANNIKTKLLDIIYLFCPATMVVRDFKAVQKAEKPK